MDYYMGEIRLFAGNYCPQDWHFCDGTILTVNGNEALYSIIGNTYGGTAPTTFALPNLQAKVVVGTGQIPGGTNNYVLGQTGGAETVVITHATMPTHTHTFNASTDAATTGDPANQFLAATNGNNSTLQPAYPNVEMYMPLPSGFSQPNGALNPQTVTTWPGGTPHDNMMPYLCLNYIIAIRGLYPQPA